MPKALSALPQPAAAVIDDPREFAAFTRLLPEAANGDRLAESSLCLGGLHCASCAMVIETALREVPGVVDASVNAAARLARVRWDAARTRPSALVQAVERAGYTAVPDTLAEARAQRASERRTMLWRLFVAAFCSMQIMMMATPSYVSAPGELAPDLAQLLAWGAWLVTLPVLLFSAAPFFRGAWSALARGRVGMDVPVALGIAVAFVASTGAAFDPGGRFGAAVYFDSLAMFVTFLLAGRALEMRARHRAAARLEAGAARLPDGVQRRTADGAFETVSPRRLAPGDVVRVPLGQAFAADGLLIEGRTAADEALLSGESRPVPKVAGDALVAGSVNLGGPVLMRVERVGADTRYEAIVALLREAMAQRPALSRIADRVAAPFLVGVLLLAGVAAAVWSVVDPARAVWVAVAMLVVTCPCALSLAVPAALLSAAGALARAGVLLRRVDALEALARVDHVFVDKTGTLTEPRLSCRPVAADDAGWLREVAASLAAWSAHPLARAFGPAVAPIEWRAVGERVGAGIEGRDADGRVWRLGAADWAGAGGPGPGEAAVWLGRDGTRLAAFESAEQARPDSVAALRALALDGLRLTLLSGDRAEAARRVGAALGIDDCQGGLRPEDKLAAIRAAQARGERVAMVGDGVNDAPVLAQADVAFALADGAAVARAQADVVLLGNSLQGVVAARAMARRTLRVIRQNIAWALLYNLVSVPLAFAGLLPPWAAGLGMATSSLLVVLNSLRLAR